VTHEDNKNFSEKCAEISKKINLDDHEIFDKLEEIITSKFKNHPFNDISGLDKGSIETIMKKYLAMSQAFPYLQAGAQKDYIFHVIKKNIDVEEHFEKTSVVGNFLCWDETGGVKILKEKGISFLPQILDTKFNFHSNLLKNDLSKIFGKKISPEYDEKTVKYLENLYVRLAFEMHAGRMIESLYTSISKHLDLKNLDYFDSHVGGDDPAEAYHVLMTKRMIHDILSRELNSQFLKDFEESYRLNYEWCSSIIEK
jgi:hypothetical protein